MGTCGKYDGFSLVEILVTIAVVAMITVFAMPKVMQAVQGGGVSNDYKVQAREVGHTIMSAYTAARLNNVVTSTFRNDDLTPYLNYARVDSTSFIDQTPNVAGTLDCSNASIGCLKLQNGGTLMYLKNVNFGGTATTNAIGFLFDPDGKVTGSSDGQTGRSVNFQVYYDGKIATYKDLRSNTCNSFNTGVNADATKDPVWFSW